MHIQQENNDLITKATHTNNHGFGYELGGQDHQQLVQGHHQQGDSAPRQEWRTRRIR